MSTPRTHTALAALLTALMGMGGLLAWPSAQAQQAAAPVPYYTPQHAIAGHLNGRAVPQSAAFARTTRDLVHAMQRHCGSEGHLPAARVAWQETLMAWEGLAALATGPLLERRSLRQVDFQPMRPELLKRALARPPETLTDMSRVGAPAKGLPGMEHLLWASPAAPGSPSCAFAVLAAQEVAHEAQTLATAFADLAAREPNDEADHMAFVEWVNQWLGGLEQLRWTGMEKPLREAETRGKPAVFARTASGQTLAAWRSAWGSLREAALAPTPDTAPTPGTGPVPIETYLRGRGEWRLADRWRQAVEQADQAMARLQTTTPADVQATANALKLLLNLMQDQVAPALSVNIGFSSKDGD